VSGQHQPGISRQEVLDRGGAEIQDYLRARHQRRNTGQQMVHIPSLHAALTVTIPVLHGIQSDVVSIFIIATAAAIGGTGPLSDIGQAAAALRPVAARRRRSFSPSACSAPRCWP
jgi:hypothetical protein